MQRLIRKMMAWAYTDKNSFVAKWRTLRMAQMIEHVKPKPGSRVIDLGGDEYLWNLLPHDYHVTMINLPGRKRPVSDPKRFTLVEADATNLRSLFKDNAFDLAFSNSVIEHVGSLEKQADFAREVRRLAPAYWVQTPSDRFPIEPHTGVVYYFRLPTSFRRRLNEKWKRDMPGFWQMVDGTTVLSRRRMQELFPDGKVFLERKLLLEKSYALYRPYPG